MLRTPLQNAPDTEIVSDGLMRYSYRDFEGRLKRLAHALSSHGVGQGDVVAVMDWDTHRYFECFFAVPMMGAVLHTVNIRLAPAQIAYTIDHAEDDVILVHADFLPLMEEVMPLVKRDVRLILLRDDPAQSPESAFDFITSYDAMMAAPADDFVFPDFDERMRPQPSIQLAQRASQRPSPIRIASLCCIRWGCWPGWGQLKRQIACMLETFICPSHQCFMFMPGDFPMRRRCLA